MRLLSLMSLFFVATSCDSFFFRPESDFARLDGAGSGVVQGQLSADEDDAAFARVQIDGDSRITFADDTGTFAVGELPSAQHQYHLRASLDEDGDGIAEFVATAAPLLREITAAKSPTDILVGGGTEETDGILLGSISMLPTHSIRGTVSIEGAALNTVDIRVVAFESLAYEEIENDPVTDLLGTVVAQSAAGPLGEFELQGISGDVLVVAYAYDVAGAPLEDLRFASEAIPVDSSDEDVVLSDEVVAIPPLLEHSVQVAPKPDDLDLLASSVSFLLTPAGKEISNCSSGATPGVTLVSGQGTFQFPVGLWDIRSCIDGRPGPLFLHRAVANVPNETAPPSFIGPFVEFPILSLDRDRDGDGVDGLLSFAQDPQAWIDCVAECQNAHGAASHTTFCGNGTIDCDDDADGQADVTEPQACIGIGLGGDRDGDGLCDFQDSYPYCALNTQNDCDPLQKNFTPQVLAEYQ